MHSDTKGQQLKLAPNDRWHELACLLLIAFELFRSAMILPEWVRGDPPRYPWEYEGRFLFTIQLVGVLSAVLLARRPIIQTATGKVVYALLLASAVGALIVDARMHP